MLIKGKEIVFGQYQFNAEEDDEIGFKAGEPIMLLEKDEKYNDGWWKGMKFNGNVGIFPSNYIIDKNILNVDVEKLLDYREQALSKKNTIKLGSPKKGTKKSNISNDNSNSSPEYSSLKSPKQNSLKSPKSPINKSSSPKSPKKTSFIVENDKSEISTSKSSKKDKTFMYETNDESKFSLKSSKSPKSPKSPKTPKTPNSLKTVKKVSSPKTLKSPAKVVMSFYNGEATSCHGSIIRSPSIEEQDMTNSMIAPLPQKNNGDDSLTLKRRQLHNIQQELIDSTDRKNNKSSINDNSFDNKNDSLIRKNIHKITIDTNPSMMSSNNAPKSPYLLRTPRSASKSPYLSHSSSAKSSSFKYNSSFTPKSASVHSPFVQKKSCLKHKSNSVPSSPVNKNNKPTGINTIDIQPNIGTMEIENFSGISGTSSFFSPNRTTRYMDDFMLNDNDPENPKNWSVDEVSDWLYKIGYVSASKFFKEKNVNGEMLVKMNLPTLREIGVSTLSERITLLHSILSLKEEYSSKCFEEMIYNGNENSENLSSPTKQSTLDANSYQMEMNNLYEKALKNPNIDDENKKKIKKMMSTFTVSDYMTESPNYDQEYIQLQNQLLKQQQLQNRQYGRDQLTLSQFNNVYNVSPQQYTMSDQYRRNVPILNNKSNQIVNPNDESLKINNHNKSLMLSAKKLVKGRNVNRNDYQNPNMMNKNEYDLMVNPLCLINNQNNPQTNTVINQNQMQNYDNNKTINFNNENINGKTSDKIPINNNYKNYGKEIISPKVKDKKHKYLNQYHDFNLATRQGWLHVKYGTFKIWKKRWAILVYDTLYLLKDQYINSEKPPRIVLVLQITANNQIDSDKQDSKKFNFKIKDPKLGTLHFAADTQLSMITWVNLFVRIITSNPIKQIQLYPLNDQNLYNNYNNNKNQDVNFNINNVEIGDHFQINKNESYLQIQKQKDQKPVSNINNNMNTVTGMYNNEDIDEYNMKSLREVNTLQEQFNAIKYDIKSMSTIGNNNSTYNSPTSQSFNNNNNNGNIMSSPMSTQQTQMIQQQLQQQYKNQLQQQQINIKKHNTDNHQNLTINTNFNNDGTLVRSKNKSPVLNNSNIMYNLNQPLNITTNRFSGEQTLLSGETTSARNTIFNRNDMYVSPSNMNHINNVLTPDKNNNNNYLNVPTNYDTNYNNPRMSLYTPVSISSETSQSYYNSPYGGQEDHHYKYSSSNNEQNQNIGRLSDIIIDPYTELRKYNYLSSIPRSAESIDDSFLDNSFKNVLNNEDSYSPSPTQHNKIESFAQ